MNLIIDEAQRKINEYTNKEAEQIYKGIKEQSETYDDIRKELEGMVYKYRDVNAELIVAVHYWYHKDLRKIKVTNI